MNPNLESKVPATTATTTTAAEAAQTTMGEDSVSVLLDLSPLLAALAAGARAVQGIPRRSSSGGNTTTSTAAAAVDENNNDDDDEFAFQSSFPEFANLLRQAQASLLQTVSTTCLTVLRNKDPHKSTLRDGNAGNADDENNNEEEDEDAIGLFAQILQNNNNNGKISTDRIHDPIVWEQCADICDALLEQVESYLQSQQQQQQQQQQSSSSTLQQQWTTRKQQLLQWSGKARQQAQSTFQIMKDSVMEMEKPQVTYQFAATINNSRCDPFIPPIAHANKPFGIIPLDLSLLLPGHGLEHSRLLLSTTSGKRTISFPPDMVAPAFHVPHVYRTEIESFVYTTRQLQAPAVEPVIPLVVPDRLDAVWIDTEEALQALATEKLATATEIAMDLEAHSYRSFAGMVCLMQISIRKNSTTTGTTGGMQNYLIDTLKLRHCMNRHLAAPLANPAIVKVMHGADSDVVWLQRDFGLYIVNLFDTGRAARRGDAGLGLPSASLSYLLAKYCHLYDDNNDNSDTGATSSKKKFQLADWRQRPLPHDMQQYAIQDTHYLLDIYERMKWELQAMDDNNENKTNSTKTNEPSCIQRILDISRQVCLLQYGKEPFYPSGYKWLLHRRGNELAARRQRRVGAAGSTVEVDANAHDLLARQEAVLKRLWDWRDWTAREQDESVQYVCPNDALLKMSSRSATMATAAAASGGGTSTGTAVVTVAALQAWFHPSMPPPCVLQFSQQVLDCIHSALQDYEHQRQRRQQQQQQQDVENLEENYDDEEEEEDDLDVEEGEDLDGEGEDDDEFPSRSMGAPSSASAFFKPSDAEKERQRRGMMSPVLGTEALYKQAGWMTPQEQAKQGDIDEENDDEYEEEDEAGGGVVEMTSGGTDDEEQGGRESSTLPTGGSGGMMGPDGKPRRLLSVHPLNKNYQSKQFSDHSLELARPVLLGSSGSGTDSCGVSSSTNRTRGRSMDGLATVRGARENSQSPVPTSVEDECKLARQNSARIRSALAPKESLPVVLGLISPSNDADDDEVADEGEHEAKDREGAELGEDDDEEEEFVVPRSMREIYKISNRNRRNKKAGSPTPERGATPTNEKEREELAKAEALLKERGLATAGYFDENPSGSPGKRPRTKSTTGRESEESVPQDATNVLSKEDDLAFMQDIGWVKNPASLMARRYGNVTSETGGGPDDVDDNNANNNININQEPAKDPSRQVSSNYPYDYSNVGPIGALQNNPSLSSASSLQQQQQSSNPFFSGAAMVGGPLAQGFAAAKMDQRPRRNNPSSAAAAKSKQNRRPERPEKMDGRTQAYRKR